MKRWIGLVLSAAGAAGLILLVMTRMQWQLPKSVGSVATARRRPATAPTPAGPVSFSDTDGMWVYGYSEADKLSADAFRSDRVIDTTDTVHFWHPANSEGGDGYYPYVARNQSDQTNASHGWAVRAGELAMEGSPTGQYSIARFTPKGSGTYSVEAVFEGIHFGLSTTDVHVLLNDRELFHAQIDGYGGDPAFHAVTGGTPSASYSAAVDLKNGDRLYFAVGTGANGTNTCDTTGLRVSVRAKE